MEPGEKKIIKQTDYLLHSLHRSDLRKKVILQYSGNHAL